MSVNMNNRRNIGILAVLIVATVVVTAAGVLWLRESQNSLILEVSYTLLVLIAALFAYDRYLVQ